MIRLLLDSSDVRLGRGILVALLVGSIGSMPGALAQDATSGDEPRVEDEAPRRRSGGTWDRAGDEPEAHRRAEGDRDQVGSDPRRGGARDAVEASATEEGQTTDPSERVRDLPTGESPTSVSPQSISLPSGEGSIEGMGESFSPVLSSGAATFNVPIAVPAGRHGVQPSFALGYGSTNGNGTVGIGWSIGVPFIARQTDRGTPRYDDRPKWHLGEDRFVYNGGQELVPVDGASMAIVDGYNPDSLNQGAPTIPAELVGWQQYRAKVESGYMRFFRSPDGKRWVVQSLDGTRFDFGVLPTSEGGPFELARGAGVQSEGANGTGRIHSWLLTRMSDAHGSTIYYQYDEIGTARYLSDVYYLSPASCAADDASVTDIRRCDASFGDYGVHVRFEYEARSDAFTSYVSGWGVTQSRRLIRITSFSAEEMVGTRYLVRRYHLAYDPGSFHSLLTSLTVEGRAEQSSAYEGISIFARTEERSVSGGFVGRRLPPMRFEYTTMPTNGPIAPGFGSIDSTIRMVTSSPPVSLDAPLVDLFDVNGDGLQDVMVTDAARYQTREGSPGVGVYWNGFTGRDAVPANAGATFSSPTVVPLEHGADVVLRYTNPNLLGMDVDGDGRGDFVHLPPTLGHGWITPARLLPIPAATPARQGWAFVHTPRPLSAANDPQIRLAQDGTFFRTFDVNNDHLIDVVRTTGTSLQTWMNLGWIPGGEGRFGHAELGADGWTISPLPITSCLPHDGLPLDFGDREVRLGDMNGDGLTDLVRLHQGRVTYWPGRGGVVFGEGSVTCASGFGSNRQIEMSTSPRQINAELTGVFLEDVDGDGASDVVQVRYHQVDVWFNRAGRGFTDRITVSSPYAPDFAPNLRFVDIDGSGTTDLLYGRANQWQYLDLLGGRRPRLLARVHNGLGATTSLEYGSSVEDYLRDLRAASECSGADCESFTWDGIRGDACDQVIDRYVGECVYRSGGSPVISSVVRRVQTTDNFAKITGESQTSTQEFGYHDGYYEGIEQEFRGYGAADTHLIGDSTIGGMWTRTYFHQGRRPNEIATTRLVENPEEALKGSIYLTEVFDEGHRYLSTTHSSFTVRHLAQGLDGRPITAAYGVQNDSFTYDTASYHSGSASIPLPSKSWEHTLPSNGEPSIDRSEVSGVRVRAQRYVWTTTQSLDVDNLGHALISVAVGRQHDEDDGPGTNAINYGETILNRTIMIHVSGSDSGWLRRPQETGIYEQDLAQGYQVTIRKYSAQGDLLLQTQEVEAATDLAFNGDEVAPGYTYGDQTILGSITYDRFGSPIMSCGGADLATDRITDCLRSSEQSYDKAYSQLVIDEWISTHLDSATSEGVTRLHTGAKWERGIHALLIMTDPNAIDTILGYDGLGRKVYVNLPDGASCIAPGPEQTLIYMPSDQTGLPIGYVETYSNARDPSSGCASPKISRVRIYSDGLGRTRGTVTWSPEERTNGLVVSGIIEIDARGQTRVAYDPQWMATEGIDPTPATTLALRTGTPFTITKYDTFGRATSITAQDGSVARVEHHASSTWSYDANDDPSQNIETSQHWNTPSISRTDGHGRDIEQIQVLRQPGESLGSAKYIHLVSTFRADGKIVEIIRGETTRLERFVESEVVGGHSIVRSFTYDTAGRRVTATDPDSDSRASGRTEADRHWRYLFNRVDDLVAVRDPRGCGQDFFYDLAGRLIAEDYITCEEAQVGGDGPVGTIEAAIGLESLGSERSVDVIYHYDAPVTWVPSGLGRPTYSPDLGRPTGITDRVQRSAISYDDRGDVIWSAKQLALIPREAELEILSGTAPQVDINDAAVIGPQVYDDEVGHTYVMSTSFDAMGRPFERTYPLDPDWTTFGGIGAPPVVRGQMNYNTRGLVSSSHVEIDGSTQTILALANYDAFGAPTLMRFRSTQVEDGIDQSYVYDNRHRPHIVRVVRGIDSGIAGNPGSLNSVSIPFAELYDWDRASNLVGITSQAGPSVFPDGRRQMRRSIQHDSLARVAEISMEYLRDDMTWGAHDEASNWRDERTNVHLVGDGLRNHDVDPMHSEPSPMVAPNSETRVVDLMYEYDWLANMTTWEDDARLFHERSIGDIANGNDGETANYRPSALYVASNIRTSPSEETSTRSGWLDVDYGESGNVVALTVRAQCSDTIPESCIDDPRLDPEARRSALLEGCTCAVQQHFQYRWDELNRLSEARRYDGNGNGEWQLETRMRARYDSRNQRTVKQSISPLVGDEDLKERIHLYVYPGDFERVGVVVDRNEGGYFASADLATETEYRVAGSRIVHKPGTPSDGFERVRRSTMAIGDLLGTASAVVDLDSGALLEMATFHPNGAREQHWMSETNSIPMERNAFTGKEEDESVGLIYFGERYLVPRIGRWLSPDPVSIHAVAGGESGNSYHYVGGNLLQARDPQGLQEIREPADGGVPAPAASPSAASVPSSLPPGGIETTIPGDTGPRSMPGATPAEENFVHEWQLLKTAVSSGQALRGIRNAAVRTWYLHQIERASREAWLQVQNAPPEARAELLERATQAAVDARNLLLERARRASSPEGRAFAQLLKEQGRTLSTLLIGKARSMFNLSPAQLTNDQRQSVLRGVIESSGRGNRTVTAAGRVMAGVGVALAAVGILAEVYEANTPDEMEHALYEGIYGALGSIAGAEVGATLGARIPAPPQGRLAGAVVGGLVGAYVGGALGHTVGYGIYTLSR